MITDVISALEQGRTLSEEERRLADAVKKYEEHFGEEVSTEERYDYGDELSELLERCVRRNRRLSQ